MKTRSLILVALLACLGAKPPPDEYNLYSTARVSSWFRYGWEWRDATGTLRAYNYFNVVMDPALGNFYQYRSVTDGYTYSSTTVYCACSSVHFPWPPSLNADPPYDPAWTRTWVNQLETTSIANGTTAILQNFVDGNIYSDEQNGVILQAFGERPAWWPKGKGKP